ncbi:MULTISPECIES: hypothetical protein [Actinoalloteichus]|uniref:Uncharacterized protein n=1 Tax=Actinoalloteichus caeruleus DSM 43889 TaxID=1120930 RepID=A0ABT1JI37_ACTCY|nr:hypothetical protein [Actinoalloteichus caeruleus]MCP2331969.1 hypothetical protein [Actinoalloteichus caeruleus DSM 43889]
MSDLPPHRSLAWLGRRWFGGDVPTARQLAACAPRVFALCDADRSTVDPDPSSVRYWGMSLGDSSLLAFPNGNLFASSGTPEEARRLAAIVRPTRLVWPHS